MDFAAQEPAAAPSKAQKEKEDAKIDDAVQIAIGVKKEVDFPTWYTNVLIKADMLDYYSVSGCYNLKPLLYSIWEEIQKWFDVEIKELGVQNSYFPMFVSAKVLEREKDHIEGFSAEVAWPPELASLSLRNILLSVLPLKPSCTPTTPNGLNPTATFLSNSTNGTVSSVGNLKTPSPSFVPVNSYGKKVTPPTSPSPKPKPKFTKFSTSTDGYTKNSLLSLLSLVSNPKRKSLRVVCILLLLKDLSLPLDEVSKPPPLIVSDKTFPDPKCLISPLKTPMTRLVKEKSTLSNTRGVCLRGLVLWLWYMVITRGWFCLLRVASIQVVIVLCGITVKTMDEQRAEINQACDDLAKSFKKVGIRAKADLRDGYTPGYKFNDWEQKGVPLEIGPNDLAKKQTLSVRRDTGAKNPTPLEGLEKSVSTLLQTIQNDMFKRAQEAYFSRPKQVTKWEDLVPTLDAKSVAVIPWCEVEACEDDIKERSAKAAEEQADERAPSAGAKSVFVVFCVFDV